MIERLSPPAALERIHRHLQQDELILGVDGFRSAPGGYIAPLDLILDLSTEPRSVADAAALAKAFVCGNSSEGVTFEIVV